MVLFFNRIVVIAVLMHQAVQGKHVTRQSKAMQLKCLTVFPIVLGEQFNAIHRVGLKGYLFNFRVVYILLSNGCSFTVQ